MHLLALCVYLVPLLRIQISLSPDGEQGEMLGHFPLHPLGHPNCTALRVRCVARSAGAHLAGRSQTRFAQTPRAPFPASPALLARVDGDVESVHGTHALLDFLISGVNPKECSSDTNYIAKKISTPHTCVDDRGSMLLFIRAALVDNFAFHPNTLLFLFEYLHLLSLSDVRSIHHCSIGHLV